jgi:hypothetical protein
MKRLLWISVFLLVGCSGTGETRTESVAETPTGLGAQYRSASGWTDDTEGPVVTFVYLSAAGNRETPRPYPLIYSSDPNNTYFHRENTNTLTVRRLTRAEMGRFLAELEANGLSDLPWEPFGLREKIGPKRGFYSYEGGSCRNVLKLSLAQAPRVIFTRVENRIIALNRE